jgi:hypothetical protein
MQVPSLKDFVLVGGTGLALLKGHRLSIDIDLFSANVPINPDVVLPELERIGKLTQKDIFSYALFLEFDNVKLDILKYSYPWIKPFAVEDGIRVASVEDIMAMKMAAITKRGSKKDFIDIYFLMKEYSIQQMLENFKKKYAGAETYMTVKSLNYFMDADPQDMPLLLKDKNISWEEMKDVIRKAIKSIS